MLLFSKPSGHSWTDKLILKWKALCFLVANGFYCPEPLTKKLFQIRSQTCMYVMGVGSFLSKCMTMNVINTRVQSDRPVGAAFLHWA